MQSPVFIFSLPRAGSTLLQRVLMSHPDIYSISEPWILLPYIYATKKEGVLSEYSSLTSITGIEDFIRNLPNKEKDYKDVLRVFITELYSRQCKNNEKYFLDKTPRYYLIIDEIVELFPNAKFIFLFRNPIHVYASIISTWGENRFKRVLSTYHDLIKGTKKLSEGFEKHKQIAYGLNYEDFIQNPENKLKEICVYLEISYEKEMLSNFSNQDTKGGLGDPTGVKKYNSISSDSLITWEKVFNSILRKRFALNLLKGLDKKHLKTQGYNKEKIIIQLKSLNNKKNKMFFLDLLDYSFSFLRRKLKLDLFFDKRLRWVRKEYLS